MNDAITASQEEVDVAAALPTAYSVRWVLAGDWDKSGGPLPQNHAPNPVEDWLELRDMCGEWDGAF